MDETTGRRRRVTGVFVALGVVVVLVVAFFIADALVRARAEEAIAQQITEDLPENVTANIDATISGFSVIGQYLTGSFESVSLDAPSVSVDGIPVSVSIVAHGVPADLTRPVQEISGTISVDEAALNQIVTIPGSGALRLEQDAVTYDGSASLFGLTLGFTVSLEPIPSGDEVTFSIVDVAVTAGPTNLDLSSLVPTATPTVCVAQYLPAGVQITDVTIAPSVATVTLTGHDLVLSEETLQTLGSCG